MTGANGFVGRTLLSRLALAGFSPTAAVRGDSLVLPNCSSTAIGPIGPDTDWSIALRRVDTVVHLAARAHVNDVDERSAWSLYRQVNVAGSAELARQAAFYGIRRLVFVSSIGVHGRRSVVPLTEGSYLSPQGPYASSKLEAEEALRHIAERSGLELVVLRPPLVYGPDAPGNFGTLLRVIKRGFPLPLRCVSNNRRSLIGIDNLVDLIIKCVHHPAASGETFLAADGAEVSTAELLRKIGGAVGRPAKLFPVPVSILRTAANLSGRQRLASQLLDSLRVDSAKARVVLGWEPPLSLDEGLSRAAGNMTFGGSE